MRPFKKKTLWKDMIFYMWPKASHSPQWELFKKNYVRCIKALSQLTFSHKTEPSICLWNVSVYVGGQVLMLGLSIISVNFCTPD